MKIDLLLFVPVLLWMILLSVTVLGIYTTLLILALILSMGGYYAKRSMDK